MTVKRHNIDLSKEAGHQYALMLWAAQPYVRKMWPELSLLYAIPNGGSRDRIEAATLKRTGLKAGVPDLCLPVPRSAFAALYIEMKRPGGHVSSNQRWWINRLMQEGNYAVVCYGWENARKVIKWYLSLPKTAQTGGQRD